MINRAGNKEKAKRVLNENGNLSGMVGMEILYRVIAAITMHTLSENSECFLV